MALKDVWKGFFKQGKRAQAAPPPKQGGGSEIGFTGSSIFAGLPMDEYNPELRFPLSTKVYDQMRKSDGQVAAVLSAMKLPIRSAKWFVDPEENADDEKLAEEIADFVRDNLFGGMKYSWDDFIRESLLMLDFGFSVFEKVYRYDTYNGKPVVMLDKYAPRIANSIWRFPQNENYDIVAVEQINYMTGQMVQIPLNRCRVFTYQREGDNIVGISALRPAYKHWYIKDALYSIVAVGIEKTLIGTPYAELPAGISEDDREKVLDLLAGVRASEEGGFTIPQGIVMNMLESAKNPMDALPFIEHHDTLMARSVLAQFINLGTMSSASGGAYALGNTMVDMFVMGLEGIANYIEQEVQKDIEQLVAWNFGPDAPVPKLSHKNIGFNDMSAVAEALYRIGEGGLIIPDEDLENYIRDLFGLPPISPDALKARQEQQQPPQKPDPKPPTNPIDPTKQEGPQPAKPQEPQNGPNSVKDPAEEQTAKDAQTTKPKQMSEPQGGIAPVNNDEEPEPAGTVHWRRDLTPLEKVVNLAEINDRWDTAESKIQNIIGEVLRSSGMQVVNKIESILNNQSMSLKNKLDAIQSLSVKFGPKLADALKSEMMDLSQFGSNSVAKELGKTSADVKPSIETTQLIAALSTQQANNLLSKMESTVITGAVNMLGRGVQPKEIIHDLGTAVEAYAQGPGVRGNATVIVSDAINIGRGSAANKMGVKGAQWSAILDQATCPLCEELDGKKIKATDPDFDIFRPPLHNHCRCMLIFIGPENTGEVYNWTTPSANLIKKYGQYIT